MTTLAFQASHHYDGAKTGIEVPIVLSAGSDLNVRLQAKVDTGASFCIFQRDYAEALGIDVESGVRELISTPTGRFEAYGHELSVSCLSWTYEATVYFAASPEFSRNVVGRAGWLQHFRVGLIDYDRVLHLSRYDD